MKRIPTDGVQVVFRGKKGTIVSIKRDGKNQTRKLAEILFADGSYVVDPDPEFITKAEQWVKGEWNYAILCKDHKEDGFLAPLGAIGIVTFSEWHREWAFNPLYPSVRHTFDCVSLCVKLTTDEYDSLYEEWINKNEQKLQQESI